MFEKSPYLSKITNITKSYPIFKDSKSKGITLKSKRHKSSNGDVIVQWIHMEKGTIIKHHHPEAETGMIYEGKIKVTVENIEKIRNIGDFIYFYPNVEHSCEMIEDSKIVFITVPTTEQYNGTKNE